MSKARRFLFFFAGLLLVAGVTLAFLRRDVEAAWLAHRLNTAKDWRDRANAAIALGRLGVRRAAADLVRRLKDPSPEVRKNCTWALAQVTGQPWGVREGEAAAWWDRYGRDFLAGRAVPDVPRVRVPVASGGGKYLEVSLALQEDRVYRLGDADDLILAVATVRNRTGKPLTVLHPPLEEYEAYQYASDGTRTPVEVCTAPPSSVVLDCTRTDRSLAGVTEAPNEQFYVLPDTIPAGGTVEERFELPVTRERPGVVFETYRFATRLNEVVLQTQEGLVTERISAAMATAYASISGKEVFEQLGEEAQEVAKSGRTVVGLAWARVHGAQGGRGHGTRMLFPPGARAYVKGRGWVQLEAGKANEYPPELFLEGAGESDAWVIVTQE